MPLKNPLKINSCDGKFYNSLDIRFIKSCDNDCSFCIERDGIDNQGQDVENMINNTLKSGCETILILGGEPFLNPKKLLHYVQGVRPRLKEIFMTTSLPKAAMIWNPDVQGVLELIDGINVSIQHYDWGRNNEILKASSKHNRIQQLKEISEKYGHKIRINLNIVKGELDTKEELRKAIELLSSFGVGEIKLNELQNVPGDEFIPYEKIMGIKMKSPFAFGCQTDISHHWNVKSKVLLKRSCFNVQPEGQREAGFFDFCKVLFRHVFKKYFKATPQKVMYEDGTLSDGWINK
jgi:pyruvate-formate lyase-activating enzyme